jgi:hypothetical protein
MARRKPRAKRGRRTAKTVPTRGHTRSPRGPDLGKPRPRVRPYKRSKPRK